jgi:predicted TPR repeat methyltransferase
VYIGDLRRFLTAAASKLRPRGLFAFSFETTDSSDYALLEAERFAHRPEYISQSQAWPIRRRKGNGQLKFDLTRKVPRLE